MTKTIEKKKVPARACEFAVEGHELFLAAEGDGPQRFTILAKSPAPVLNHWWWGNLAIDLAGIKGKSKIPILVDHDVSQRIGVSDSRSVDKSGLTLSGTFLKNSALAQQVRNESRDGFPWEASVRLFPTKIEVLREGAQAEVNGLMVQGPGHIFRNSELRETSFTALGADSNTSAAALSDTSPELEVEFCDTATAEEPMTKKIDEAAVAGGPGTALVDEKKIREETQAATLKAERERIAAIQAAAAPEQGQLVQELIVGGAEASAATLRLNEDLRNRFKQLAERLNLSDKPLSGGNTGGDANTTKLAQINAMPEGRDKWAARWDSDPKLNEQFMSKDHYIALQHVELAGWNPTRIPRLLDASGKPMSAKPHDVQLASTSPSAPVTIAGVRAGYAMTLQAQLGMSWSRTVASAFDSSSPSENYPWLRMAPQLRKWEGERSAQEIVGDSITLFNDDYEGTIEFRIPDLRRDKTGQIMARAADLATRVAFFPESLLTSLITANGNAYDGVAYFATSHAIGSSGTINNAIVSGDGLAGGATPTTAQQSTNILLLLSRMLAFLDDQGQPMNEAARQFIVMTPPGLYGATVAAISAMFTSASATNPLGELARFGYSFVPLLNARLTTTNVFYMFRTDAGIRSFLLQEEGVAPVELGPDSEHAKKTNRALFGHGWAGAVGYGRFELAIRGTTS
jgi:hypothetical protein